MKKLVLLALAALGGACARPPEPVVIKEPDKPMELHPLTKDKDYLTDQKVAQAIRKARKETEKTSSKSASQSVSPEILGEYRLVLDPDQQKSIDDALKRLEEAAAAGDKQAVSALPIARAAQQAAQNMVVTLKPGGSYVANLGTGETTGTYIKSDKGLILKPAVPSKDPYDPPDVEFAWDKAKKQLTVDFQGRIMVFKRTK